MPAQATLPPFSTAIFQMRVQLFPTRCAGDGDHEVAPRIANQAFHLALIVALRRPAKLLREQVVTLHLRKGSGLLPFAVTQDPRHRQLGVVIKNARGNTAKIGERPHMAFQKSFGGLSRKCRHEAIVGVRQIERKIMRRALHAGDHHQSFSEISLRFARRVAQWHEHLPGAGLGLAHVILHNRVATRVAVLFP